MTVELATGRAEYGAGGGITWASRPDEEWDELVAKMRVLDHPAPPDGLLETLLVDGPRGPRHLDRHLARMGASAAYFAMPFDEAAARAAVALAAPTGSPGSRKLRLRITLAADGHIGVDTSPAPPAPSAPVRLALADAPVDSRDPSLFHKTTDRTRYERWRRTGGAGADDVILWNERGEVTETTIASLVAELAGGWWTPPLTSGLLPGVERRRRLDLGELRERVLTIADIRVATSLGVISSLRGWRPAILVR